MKFLSLNKSTYFVIAPATVKDMKHMIHIPSLTIHKPDIVAIHIGLNNITYHNNESVTFDGIAEEIIGDTCK